MLPLLLFAASVQHGLRVPDGFEVTLVADHTTVNDTHCMTVAPDGRLAVSGRGYVRLLGADGKPLGDFAGAPKDGAMGLHFDGGDLYAVGDGGLKVWRGADPKRPPELIYRLKTGGEHTAHAVQRGPDGWMYLIVGDGTDVTAKDIASDASPVKEPVGGCVLRFSPDWKRREVFAHGFRNAYGMDFGPDGELYTFDSDNERCVGLPWYEPTRFYRVRCGGHHGWLGPKLAATWRLPPYYPDVVAPLATLGRGSPTGVAVYKHASFPPHYRGGAFLLDWTFGVIHFVALSGRTTEVFAKAVGGDGFAPTSAAVHPDTGDLYVSVGGRGTRGGVYRIRHLDGVKAIDREEVKRLRPRPAVVPAAVVPTGTLAEARAVQIALGGPPSPSARGTVWEGYSRAGTGPVPEKVRGWLRAAFPSGDERLDTELTRTLAMIEDDSPEVTRKILSKPGLADDPVMAVHALAVLGRLKGPSPPDAARRVATELLRLEQRYEAAKVAREGNWPPRIAEIHAALAARLPTLNDELVNGPLFGRPGHVVFTRAKGFDRVKAARRFLAASKGDGFVWSDALVRVVAELPDETALPTLRGLWGKAGVDDEILVALARRPTGDDRPKLLTGLMSARLSLVAACLSGLEKLPPERPECLTLVRALQQLPAAKETDALRRRVTARLERASGHNEPSLEGWLAWARKTFPDQAASLADLDGVDVEAWNRRLAKIDWAAGDARRGEAVFMRASCASCHSGAAALGPDLAGVAKRFARADLLTAIVRPSKDVSERYRTTRVVTARGAVHVGVIVYEAVDGLILQTGPGLTVRVPGAPAKAPSPRSLMPAGLLDRLTDADIADLLAHLAAR